MMIQSFMWPRVRDYLLYVMEYPVKEKEEEVKDSDEDSRFGGLDWAILDGFGETDTEEPEAEVIEKPEDNAIEDPENTVIEDPENTVIEDPDSAVIDDSGNTVVDDPEFEVFKPEPSTEDAEVDDDDGFNWWDF